MVGGSTPSEDLSCLEAIDDLARLTNQLRRAADAGDPGLADLAQSCARALFGLQQQIARKPMLTRNPGDEDRHALAARLAALNAETGACVRSLECVLAETEQRLQSLRHRQRAARGYGNCLRRN